jgi:hypothetical protein
MFLYLLTFFGLTPEYRLRVFKQIHEIVFHGGGGYDWNTIYNMPIWLRRFTFETLREHFEKQNEEAEKQQNMLKNNGKSKGDISRPNIAPKQPTYTTKAPRK